MPLVHRPPDLGPPQEEGGQKPRGWFSRGYLPHFDAAGIYQFITYSLFDTKKGRQMKPHFWLKTDPDIQDPSRPVDRTVESTPLTKAQKWAMRIAYEKDLDKGYGSCILRDAQLAKIVVDAWKYFDGERYGLVAYVVMPNHVHLLIKTFDGFSLPRIVHSWKSYSAHKIRKCLAGRGNRAERDDGGGFVNGGRRDADGPGGDDRDWGCGDTLSRRDAGGPGRPIGPVWGRDYFDRYIRDWAHFEKAVNYIHLNPVMAGLCSLAFEWPWSSASEFN